jgi:hypothetical protein
MVIAFVALLVAGGGAAVAAVPDSDDGEIHGCYSTNGTLRVIDAQAGATCNSKKGETALVWNQQGPQGDPGTPGSDAGGAVTARAETANYFGGSTPPPSGTPLYAGTSGETAFVNYPNPGLAAQLSPGSTIGAQDLAVKAVLSPGYTSATFTLMDDGSPTSVSCTITPPADSCDSGATTATISPGSELATRMVTTGDPEPQGEAGGFYPAFSVQFGWRATTP